MADFSQDEHRATPRQFRAGPGQLGVDAARRGLKTRPGASGRTKASQPEAAPPSLGLPQPHDEPPDLRHIAMGLQALNSNQLGRGLPFGIWFQRSGFHTNLPGWQPLDWLDV
jgi:hypothetical protein